MQKSAIGYAIGKLLQVTGILMLVPLGIAAYDYRHLSYSQMLSLPECLGFCVAIIFALILGSVMALVWRRGRKLQGIKEGYAIVTLGWTSLAFVAAIPFTFYFLASPLDGSGGLLRAFTDAYFEVMSGFTTTGASILSNVEAVPRSLLFLRALTHWLGGMGIITLAIAIFPAMGVSGYMMFRGEVPGPSKDKLQPRLAQTASILWGVYLLFTAIETGLLMFGGMNLFDAVCHTFATMATGGFSTQNGSVASYNSDFIEWVIIIFMYLAGINFLLHFKALRGDLHSLVRNKEFSFYSAVVISTIIVVTAVLYFNGPAPMEEAASHYRASDWTAQQFSEHYAEESVKVESLNDSFRVAAFQSLAIITTTGFVTADFDLWPDFLRFGLLVLMFFGGCAGSTGGGIKMLRVMVVTRVAMNQLRKLAQPRLVLPIKIGSETIDDQRVSSIVAFFLLFVSLFVLTAALMTLFVPDLMTAISCSIATIGNIGPGLAGIGAVENYGWIPIPGKWVLVWSMLLGRLEIFTVLIVMRVSVWRK